MRQSLPGHPTPLGEIHKQPGLGGLYRECTVLGRELQNKGQTLLKTESCTEAVVEGRWNITAAARPLRSTGCPLLVTDVSRQLSQQGCTAFAAQALDSSSLS